MNSFTWWVFAVMFCLCGRWGNKKPRSERMKQDRPLRHCNLASWPRTVYWFGVLFCSFSPAFHLNECSGRNWDTKTNELNERVKREVIPKVFRISAAEEVASSLPFRAASLTGCCRWLSRFSSLPHRSSGLSLQSSICSSSGLTNWQMWSQGWKSFIPDLPAGALRAKLKEWTWTTYTTSSLSRWGASWVLYMSQTSCLSLPVAGMQKSR